MITHALSAHDCVLIYSPTDTFRVNTITNILKNQSVLASTATDSCTSYVTASNDVALPNSKQGTLWVTSAFSNGRNISTKQQNRSILSALEPVPFARINNNIHQSLTTNPIFQLQSSSTCASVQFFDALGNHMPVYFGVTAGKIRCVSLDYNMHSKLLQFRSQPSDF